MIRITIATNAEEAIAPSLQLIDPKPLSRQKSSVLLGGLSEARQGFNPLPNVELKVKQVSDLGEAEVLLNQAFTEAQVGTEITGLPYTVVHMATHGKFSSNLEDTYILTWDEKIKIEELRLLLSSNVKQENPIELLVLSACTTAGDKRAALGLAGMALRSGARSTIASLWTVDDKSTALLMTYFYQELAQTQATKAEAMRRAQQRILQEQGYNHPYFWSGFILVGNWL
ncbi:MAG: CHAT domain-containing protein [Microcoleaceae cyanobacterium]